MKIGSTNRRSGKSCVLFVERCVIRHRTCLVRLYPNDSCSLRSKDLHKGHSQCALNATHSESLFNVSNIGQTASLRSEKVWGEASEMLWNGLRNSSDSVFLDLALCRWNPDPFALRRGWEAEDDSGGARSEQGTGSAKSNDSVG